MALQSSVQINLTDLIDIRHGDALLEVDSKRVKVKGVVVGHRGIVKVKFPKTPQANYTVQVEGPLSTMDADATAEAIKLRADLIAQNKVVTP